MIKKMKKENTYQILDNGTCNCEFYSQYFNCEFHAKNDAKAIKRVEKWQKKCEHEQENAGVPLSDYDPTLANYIQRYDPEKDEWIDVAY